MHMLCCAPVLSALELCCGEGGKAEQAFLKASAADLKRVSAQKGSFFADSSEATALVAEIDKRWSAIRATQRQPRLLTAGSERQGRSPTRDELIVRIDTLGNRLGTSEARLGARQQPDGPDVDTGVQADMAMLRDRRTKFGTQNDRQRMEIDDLTTRLRELEEGGSQLPNSKLMLNDTVLGVLVLVSAGGRVAVGVSASVAP